MTDKSSWEQFFDGHAPIYQENVFVHDTIREVDFLLEEMALPPGATILDVACGTGRHSIELARRGYCVTGLDLSTGMLDQAARAAAAAGVQVDWVHGDATRFSFPGVYDGAICLCEGAMGLLSATDDAIEQPLSILRNIAGSLKPGGKVILTVLSALVMIRRAVDSDVATGWFDPVTLVESSGYSPREGLPEILVRERAFVPTELILLCRLANLSVLHVWGGTAGNWGRRPLDLDEMEIMIVAAAL